MAKLTNAVFDFIDSTFAWFSSSLKQTTESYCDIETAEDETTLVGYDGSLASIIEITGVTYLMGSEEFEYCHDQLLNALQNSLKESGHTIQFYFSYDPEQAHEQIRQVLHPSRQTAKRLELDLEDLFEERNNYLASYCAKEQLFCVIWTNQNLLSKEQSKQAAKNKLETLKKGKITPNNNSQNPLAGLPELRDEHHSFVRSLINDFTTIGLDNRLLEVHEAVRAIRSTADLAFTDLNWKPVLPGDKIPARNLKHLAGEISDIMWPPLGKQILPRDAFNLDLKTCQIGNHIYGAIFIDLFPQDVRPFLSLFNRTLPSQIPWRISYHIHGGGSGSIRLRSLVASILSFASSENKLLSDANKMLQSIDIETDDAVVKLQVALTTWAHEDEISVLHNRMAELAKAVQGWGNTEVSENCGDAFAGTVSTMMGVSRNSVATTSIAPLSDVITMLPFTRPASPWSVGSLLLRSPDGKLWPYQPGSSQQTTWIDLIYARPGSGKSVLSNAINLSLCLAPGIQYLPYIGIIDIGPSSSGLISLLRDALPPNKRHQVAYHRLQMLPEYSINPFDTQLGMRHPTPQERSFLVNFITLLATPLGQARPYDGISDMAGLIVNELYNYFSDDNNPRVYTPGAETLIDELLDEIEFVKDPHTTWWEVTDALFVAGFIHEAMMAQRYAMPLLADAVSIARNQAVQDLYGDVHAPTGENLISAFTRMISSAVREYPILSRVTSFDIGDAHIVSLDLDEVAKSGGDAAERQTSVMYMLARYVVARHFFVDEELINQVPEKYREYHSERISELQEAPKRLVYDEFHRTSKSLSVREQVVLDMREGRKRNVQIALISQSLEDFDSTMVEFGTSIFIMDAGPAQTVKRSVETFGLTETAKTALKNHVHGPKKGGATFLAQFATKKGTNLQLLTNTIGPVEIWAFSTTTEDASIRNKLYRRLGPAEARRILAKLFPQGTIKPVVEERLSRMEEEEQEGLIEEADSSSIVEELVEETIEAYYKQSS